jgi:hypothetical protein
MKKTKSFNNVSDTLLKQIPKLKPEETVVFRMLNGVPNPEPDEKERSKSPVLYPKVQVITNFRIFDKYQKDDDGNEVGGYVDVVCADGWVGDAPTKVRTFVPGNEKGKSASLFQGKFQLRGGVVKDEELFEILWLSPQRKGTPCPDPSVEQIFEMVDLKADNSNKVNKFEKLSKVIEITKSITPANARMVMRALGQPEYQDDVTLLAMTKDFATKNVDAFLSTHEDKDTSTKADLREAVNTGTISHNFASGDVTLLGTVVANVKISNPDQFIDSFTRWVNTSKNGKDVLNNIKTQMAKEEVKK